MHIFDSAYEHFDFPAVGENPIGIVHRADRFQPLIGIGHRADRFQPLIGMNRRERERERERMCRLVVMECGLGLRRVKEGHVKESK